MKSRHLKNIPQIVKLDRAASLMNRQCLDAFHVRARTRGVATLTAHHPFLDAAWVLACYNSDNYVTNASKDKELLNDVDGPLAREQEFEKRDGCLVAQLPVILPL